MTIETEKEIERIEALMRLCDDIAKNLGIHRITLLNGVFDDKGEKRFTVDLEKMLEHLSWLRSQESPHLTFGGSGHAQHDRDMMFAACNFMHDPGDCKFCDDQKGDDDADD